MAIKLKNLWFHIVKKKNSYCKTLNKRIIIQNHDQAPRIQILTKYQAKFQATWLVMETAITA